MKQDITLNFAKKNTKHMRRPYSRVLIVFSIIFAIYSLILLFPFFWVFINSFKNGFNEFKINSWSLPEKWMFSNYTEVFKLDQFNVVEMFFNTILLCLIVPTMSVLSTTLAAYVMAKYKFPGRKFLYVIYILPMIVSIAGTTTSVYILLDNWGLTGTFGSIILLSCAGTGMNFLLVYAVFKNISDTYAEAARIDGAGDYRIFFQVMVPQAMGIIGTLWILGFIGSWNDYATPKIFLGSDYYTIATGLEKIKALIEKGGNIQLLHNYPVYFAAIIISMLPVVIIFLIFQKQIMKISLSGGLK